MRGWWRQALVITEAGGLSSLEIVSLGSLHALFSLKLNYCETFHSIGGMTYFKECINWGILNCLDSSHKIIEFFMPQCGCQR